MEHIILTPKAGNFITIYKLVNSRFEQLQVVTKLNMTMDAIRDAAVADACVSGGSSGAANGALANVSIAGANLTLSPDFLDFRSEVIATYALCGFANFR